MCGFFFNIFPRTTLCNMQHGAIRAQDHRSSTNFHLLSFLFFSFFFLFRLPLVNSILFLFACFFFFLSYFILLISFRFCKRRSKSVARDSTKGFDGSRHARSEENIAASIFGSRSEKRRRWKDRKRYV